MKTLEQIVRYTSHCRFPDDDWQKVLAYCKGTFGGGKIHKAMSPVSDSTYGQFENWVDHGFGSGDMVSYGNTMGLVGSSTPDRTFLAAYCDYEGNLIAKNMDVLDVSRLKPLDDGRKRILKRLIFENGLDYSVKTSVIVKMYTPKENFHVVLGNDDKGNPNVGMFLESNGCNYHFSAFLQNGEIKMDCWIDSDYTPLKPASNKDIQRFHRVLSKAGWSYNGRANKFIQQPRRRHDNIYWYLNDRFEIVMDKDNGMAKHTERFDAGNYFLDYTYAITFMRAVRKMCKEEL